MAKLMDIKGYWNDKLWNDTYEGIFLYNTFDKRNIWEGQILVNDDGWFEGIVVDPYSTYLENRFVFGIYHEDKLIELYKFTPISVSNPFVFHGIGDFNGFYGELESIGLYEHKLFGDCYIVTKESRKDTFDLEEKIDKYKQYCMDDSSKYFYNNILYMKDSLSKELLNSYEETSNPETVIKPKLERIKKLSKELRYGSDKTDLDEELPFY